MHITSRSGEALAYRPDIDGLRAVAVLAVVFYHANVWAFSGGFVGVDVFFVISGYLITQIIQREYAAGRFSYFGFYERRIRRIAPALILVGIAACLYTFALRTPVEARLFGQSISFLAIFLSNHFFYQETGYFADAADGYLLLHTWSLAVEEQFYLVFPLALGLLAPFGGRVTRIMLLAAAILSFAACVIAEGVDATAAFFLSPFRFWEILIGALLALSAWSPRAGWPAEIVAALGLLGVLGSVFLFDERTAFPEFSPLAPTIATAALIAAGAAGSRVTSLLATRAPVAIGKISYSLYLWHWPLLVAFRDLGLGESGPWRTAAALALSIVFSTLSYRYVEAPFRARGTRARIRFRHVAIGSGVAAAAFIGVGTFLQETRGWPGRWPDTALRWVSDEARKFGVDRNRCRPARDMLPEALRSGMGEEFCVSGEHGAPLEVMVWGDSHALALWPAVDGAARAAGVSVLLATRGACPPLLPPAEGSMPKRLDRAKCLAHSEMALEAIVTLGIRRVLLVGHWPAYASLHDVIAVRASLEATLEAIAGHEVETFVAINAPSYTKNVPLTYARASVLGLDPGIDLSRAHHEARIAPIIAALEPLRDRLSAPPIRLDATFCDKTRCHVESDDAPLYRDSNHLNHTGARLLTPVLAAVFEQ